MLPEIIQQFFYKAIQQHVTFSNLFFTIYLTQLTLQCRTIKIPQVCPTAVLVGRLRLHFPGN